MSNRYHLVLFVDRDECDYASAKDVVERWHKSFAGLDITQRYIKGEFLELELLDTLSLNCRKRLQDISWFLKALKHYIAKRGNHEDVCTGHFGKQAGELHPLPLAEPLFIVAPVTVIHLSLIHI